MLQENLEYVLFAMHVPGGLEASGILLEAGEQQIPIIRMVQELVLHSCYCQLFHAETRQLGMALSARLQSSHNNL